MPTAQELTDLFENDEISIETAVRLILTNQIQMAATLNQVHDSLKRYPSLTWLIVHRTRQTFLALTFFLLLMWLFLGGGGPDILNKLIAAATGLPMP